MRLKCIIHRITEGNVRDFFLQIGCIKRGRGAVGTSLSRIIATAIGTNSLIPYKRILIAYQSPTVVVFIDKPTLVGVHPTMKQTIVGGKMVNIITHGERCWQYQLHMIEQIGVCHTLCCGTSAAVANLQDGIGSEVAARRTPYAEIVDADVISLKDSGIAHIDDTATFTAAIQYE